MPYENKRPIRMDRFGRSIMVIGLKDRKASGYPKGYVDIGNNTYMIETSPSQKDGVEQWVKLTKLEKKKQGQF